MKTELMFINKARYPKTRAKKIIATYFTKEIISVVSNMNIN